MCISFEYSNIFEYPMRIFEYQFRHSLTSLVTSYSCIEIYSHSCLKPFSIGRKPCSNSKTHVQIMKFTCRLNMGFGRRHWSMRRDVICFVLNKMADVEEAPRVSRVFTLLMLFSRDFKWIGVKMQE